MKQNSCKDLIKLPQIKGNDNLNTVYDISFCKTIQNYQAQQYSQLPLLDRGHFGIVKDNQNSVIKILKAKRKDCSQNYDPMDEDCKEQKQIEAEIFLTKKLYASIYKAQQFDNQGFLQYEQDRTKLQQNFVKVLDCYVYQSFNSIYYLLELEKLDFDLGYMTSPEDFYYKDQKQNSKGLLVNQIFRRTRSFDENYVVEIMMNLFQQLSIMHDFDLVHGDIQPENILARMNERSQNLTDEELRTFFENHKVTLVLADYGLMKKEGETTQNFSKLFSHPALLLNYESSVPLYKQSDVYSLCLTLLTISSYKEGQIGQFYYPNILKKEFENLQDSQISYEMAEQAYARGFEKMKVDLNRNNFVYLNAKDLRDCINHLCVFLKGIELDMNQIPTAKQIFQQLKRIQSYLTIIVMTPEQKYLHDMQSKFQNCLQVSRGQLSSLDQDKEMQMEYQNNCIDENSQEYTWSMNLQISKYVLGSSYQQYTILIVEKYREQFQQHFNMDYGYFNQVYQKKSVTKLTILQRYYCNMNFNTYNNKVQFYSNGLNTIYYVENFLRLFEGLQKVQDLGFAFIGINPSTIVQPTFINNIKNLNLKFLLIPITQNGMDFGFKEPQEPDIYGYPAFGERPYSYKYDNFSLSLSCLYILFSLNRQEINVQQALEKSTESVTIMRKFRRTIQSNYQDLSSQLPVLNSQFDQQKEKYFGSIRINAQKLLNQIYNSYIDETQVCQLQSTPESVLVCILSQSIQHETNLIPDTQTIIDQLKTLKQKMSNTFVVIQVIYYILIKIFY